MHGRALGTWAAVSIDLVMWEKAEGQRAGRRVSMPSAIAANHLLSLTMPDSEEETNDY